jgi:hypothetical protein
VLIKTAYSFGGHLKETLLIQALINSLTEIRLLNASLFTGCLYSSQVSMPLELKSSSLMNNLERVHINLSYE